MTILVFDSGLGGLTILREARAILPDQRFVYIGDDEGFPYGEWEEDALAKRITSLFDRYINDIAPDLAIIACNTASTLIMPALRETFDLPFVGTVPAIKPAAELSSSKMISVLGTPGTVKRRYTKDLIQQFATDVEVNLVGASGLATIAEKYMQHISIDQQKLQSELSPCFKRCGERKTDIVVLACTHYPFLVNEMRKLAPWPVDWLDPSVAIARRALSLIDAMPSTSTPSKDFAIMTSGNPTPATKGLLRGFGLDVR